MAPQLLAAVDNTGKPRKIRDLLSACRSDYTTRLILLYEKLQRLYGGYNRYVLYTKPRDTVRDKYTELKCQILLESLHQYHQHTLVFINANPKYRNEQKNKFNIGSRSEVPEFQEVMTFISPL